MKNFFVRVWHWFNRLPWIWRLRSPRNRAIAGFGREWVEAFDDAVKQLDQLPQTDPAPLPFVRVRQLSRAFCADHCGLGFRLPAASPAEGFFWRRDADGFAWRLYRERV